MGLSSSSLCSSTCNYMQSTNEPSILHLHYSVFYFHHDLLIHSISIFVYIIHLFLHIVDLIHQSQHINIAIVVLNFLIIPTHVKYESESYACFLLLIFYHVFFFSFFFFLLKAKHEVSSNKNYGK